MLFKSRMKQNNGFFKGVPIFNSKPRFYKKGGYIELEPTMTRSQRDNDSIQAILQAGELIIPRKFNGISLVPKVIKFLKKNNIHLPNT